LTIKRSCRADRARVGAANTVAFLEEKLSQGVTMRSTGLAIAFAVVLAGAALADDVTDAIEAGRKAYADGELAKAKEELGLASQLIGQKHAEAYAKMLPAPLAGWKADEVEIAAVGSAAFGASSALRRYENPAGDQIEVQISSDSAVIAQFAAMMATREVAGAMGKIVPIGSMRALQSVDGDLHMAIGSQFIIAVQGNASVADKLAYARAIDLVALSKL
jgi:hypothetical protein